MNDHHEIIVKTGYQRCTQRKALAESAPLSAAPLSAAPLSAESQGSRVSDAVPRSAGSVTNVAFFLC